jgi:hypothetical protein
MPLTPPSSESSPTTPAHSSPPGASAPEAARMPSAIGRSNAGPSFLRLAGARFTITRFAGLGGEDAYNVDAQGIGVWLVPRSGG